MAPSKELTGLGHWMQLTSVQELRATERDLRALGLFDFADYWRCLGDAVQRSEDESYTILGCELPQVRFNLAAGPTEYVKLKPILSRFQKTV